MKNKPVPFLLDMLDLPASTYAVEVNGISETFTLDADNSPS